ncbi:MAG: ATP-binding cassette domain-containing protein [Oscillospiraceae bacterium]|jgi:ATP-binding cassette subfamily B protein|nr:ATP-binding cassette domain-containing protein [Oscillospiraceae bacterium]
MNQSSSRKKRRKPEKKQAQAGSLPGEVLALLEAQGLTTVDFLLGITGDMDGEGCFRSAWLAFDAKGLYLAFGTEALRRKKQRGKSRTAAVYTLEELQTIPLEAIAKLKVEQYVTTGRLIAEMPPAGTGRADLTGSVGDPSGTVLPGSDDVALTRFSVGKIGDFQQLCSCFNAYKEGRDWETYLPAKDEAACCPKCGQPFPPGKRICPACGKQQSTVRRLFAYFGSYKKEMALVLLTLLLGSAFTVAMPKVSTQLLFDQVLNEGNANPLAWRLAALGWVVLAAAGMRLLDTAMHMLYDYILAIILPKMTYDIKRRIFSSMQRLSVGFYSSKQTGSLMERVTRDAMSIYLFSSEDLPRLVMNVVMLAGELGLMVFLSWKMTLLVLSVLPLMVLLLIFGDRIFRRVHHRIWTASAKLTSLVSDNINGQRVIKAFAKEPDELRRFEGLSGSMAGAEIDQARTESTLFPFITALVFLLSMVVLAVGGLDVLAGKMTVGKLLSFTIYLTMIAEPVDFLSWISNHWARAMDAAHRVFEITDTEPDLPEKEDPVQLTEIRGDVELRELEFAYEPAHPVIRQVSLRVGAGQMLGIVGKTGAGKTTIANLISRLYDAKAGAVLLDGVDVRDLPMAQLRRHIGLVSQDIFLFTGSIADNIRYAKPAAGMAEVMAAAKAAAAHNFIMKLPDAYETRVGSGGQALSGGERQRISIARAILQNPKILILDEATAAMDTATERSIQASLAKLQQGRTTIAIAHRLSTLRDADVLAVIEDGKLTEFGSFRDLLQLRGAFYRLYQIQSQAMAQMRGIGTDGAKEEEKEEDPS